MRKKKGSMAYDQQQAYAGGNGYGGGSGGKRMDAAGAMDESPLFITYLLLIIIF